MSSWDSKRSARITGNRSPLGPRHGFASATGSNLKAQILVLPTKQSCESHFWREKNRRFQVQARGLRNKLYCSSIKKMKQRLEKFTKKRFFLDDRLWNHMPNTSVNCIHPSHPSEQEWNIEEVSQRSVTMLVNKQQFLQGTPCDETINGFYIAVKRGKNGSKQFRKTLEGRDTNYCEVVQEIQSCTSFLARSWNQNLWSEANFNRGFSCLYPFQPLFS